MENHIDVVKSRHTYSPQHIFIRYHWHHNPIATLLGTEISMFNFHSHVVIFLSVLLLLFELGCLSPQKGR